MELYTLDSLFRRKEVVDKFESLIWTERWNAMGDFELNVDSSLNNRSTLMIGTRLAMNNSKKVMVIETVEDKITDEDKEILNIKGRSLEAILEDRVAREFITNVSEEPNIWYITGSPIGVARFMYEYICRAPGGLDPGDVIPFVDPMIAPPVGLPLDEDVIDWLQKTDTLYNAIRDICVTYDLGFEFTLHRTWLIEDVENNYSYLLFTVYGGNDRTSRQTDNPVIFSPSLDNLKNTTEFTSIQNYKNVAYVFTDTGTRIVFRSNALEAIGATGFERRVLLHQPTIPTDSPVNDHTGRLRLGREALRHRRRVNIFEGEVDQHLNYKYGVDYYLGDLVEVRNKDGDISYKRVTEQIFVDDVMGERAYPTLSLGMFEAENTWGSYTNNETAWENMITETWADL